MEGRGGPDASGETPLLIGCSLWCADHRAAYKSTPVQENMFMALIRVGWNVCRRQLHTSGTLSQGGVRSATAVLGVFLTHPNRKPPRAASATTRPNMFVIIALAMS
jgi:hypothetical protein